MSAEPRISAACADVLDRAALAAAVTGVAARHGRLDAVVHCAQVMAYGRIEDVPPEIFERVVDTAVHGLANVARLVLPHFRERGAGTLVVVSSLLGEIATPGMGAYDTGKWGQLGLARVLQLEVRDAPGVDVCTVSPGAVNTPIYDQAANYADRGSCPPPPVLDPDRVARTIVDLLDRPRRHVEVGPLNLPTILGFRLLPFVYDRIVGPLVTRLVFHGSPSAGNGGNVLHPVTELESERGRWTRWGRPGA